MNVSDILYHNFLEDPWFNPKKKVLLALSGGLDSMVLFDLCVQLKLNFYVAHYCYGLRPKENIHEKELIAKTCQKHKIEYFIKEASQEEILSLQEGNLQEKARDLRYLWFNLLKEQHHFDFLFTAHHQQDQVETILFNLTRGSGLNGLGAMALQQGWHIRPLLLCSKNNIIKYATLHHIAHCEDSSNASLKYTRNKIRHQIIPSIENNFPNGLQNISNTAQRLQNTSQLINELLELFIQTHCKWDGNSFIIPCAALLSFKQHSLLLYYLIKMRGFNWVQTENILNAVKQKHEGALIKNNNYELIYSRGLLYLIPTGNEAIYIAVNSYDYSLENTHFKIQCSLQHHNELINLKDGAIYLDADVLNFPIIIRNSQQGDKFKPFGSAHQKLVSDYIQSKKLNPIQKRHFLVVENQKTIAAILPHTSSNAFAVSRQTKNILKIVYKKGE